MQQPQGLADFLVLFLAIILLFSILDSKMPVSVALTEDHLVAIVSLIPPSKPNMKLNPESVINELNQLKFSNFLSEQYIRKALSIFNSSKKGRAKFRIYRDDFLDLEQYFEVKVSENEMLAYLNINILPELIEKVNYNFLKRLLMKHGISSCILIAELNNLVKQLKETPKHSKFLVASGSQEIIAIDGELKFHETFTQNKKIERIVKKGDARQKILVPARITSGPLSRNTILLTKYLPIDGKAGLTVTGKRLWSESNKKQTTDPAIVVSKNINQRKFHDRIEYLTMVKGIGYFIDQKIIEVEEVLDGDFLLAVSEDRMELMLSLQASKGGKDIDLAEIRAALAKMKLKVPVDEDILVSEVSKINNRETEQVTRVVIARGIRPEDGEDGELQWYTNLEQFYRPRILENGSVDYRGGQCYPYAHEGVPVGIWYLASKGVKAGHDIFGNPIPPDDGKKVSLSLSKNFEFEDALSEKREAKLLVPRISGLIKTKRDDVTIDPVLEVETVDYTTGNINFEGTLIIKNTVTEGFTIHCSKDIHIKGNIGACTIECDGDIIVQGGMNGRGKGSIKAGGNVHIKFAENCTICADASIFISSHTVLSRIISRQKILVGVNRTKGKIIGSEFFAWDSIETNQIGTKSSTADSSLYIGIDKILYDQVEIRKQKIEDLKLEITELQQKIIKCKCGDESQKQMIEQELSEKVEYLNDELAGCQEWEENIYNSEPGTLLVKDEIQMHTGLFFAKLEYDLVVTKSKIEFSLDNEKIIQTPIQRKR